MKDHFLNALLSDLTANDTMQGISPQLIMIIKVLVAEHQAINPLANEAV